MWPFTKSTTMTPVDDFDTRGGELVGIHGTNFGSLHGNEHPTSAKTPHRTNRSSFDMARSVRPTPLQVVDKWRTPPT